MQNLTCIWMYEYFMKHNMHNIIIIIILYCECQGFISYDLVLWINTVMYGYSSKSNTCIYNIYRYWYICFHALHAQCFLCYNSGQSNIITKALIKTNDNVLNCC